MLILMVVLTVTPYYVFFGGEPPATPPDPVLVGRRVAFTLLVPVLAYDAVKFGRIHRAHVIGIGLFLLSILGFFAVWNSTWWQRTVAAVFGFDN